MTVEVGSINENPSVFSELLCWITQWIVSILPPLRSSTRKRARPGRLNTVESNIIIGRSGSVIGSEWLPGQIESVLIAAAVKSQKIAKPIVVFGAEAGLVRTYADCCLPLARAQRLAGLDLELNTPFKLNDVFLFVLSGKPGESGRYLVVKRETFEPFREAFADMKTGPHAILAESDGQLLEVHPAIVSWLGHQLRGQPKLLRLFIAASVFSVLISGINFDLAMSGAVEEVDQLSTEMQTRLDKVRGNLDRHRSKLMEAAKIRADTAERIPLTMLIDSLTRALPDGTYVSDLQYSESKLRISGYSQSAASLIAAIGVEHYLRNPRFISPVVRVTDRNLDQFTIEMDVSGNG